GSIHFIAMEYVDGIDLHVKVKQDGPLGVREAADFIRQAALGLHRAHEAGLVHRDIKPANLMLDQHGVVKILDFGLALARSADDDEDASLTQEHDEKVLGTADYLAPEQARDSHVADRRSDIYALGCTLFYLLTGRAPFAKGSIAERIQAHMKRPPPNLLEERGDVPPAIAELYFRMLEKHPDARPQTAQQIADSLAAWLASTAEGGPRPRLDPPRRQPPRRSPRPAADPGSSNVHYAPPARPGSSSSGLPVARAPAGDSGSLAPRTSARPTAARSGGAAAVEAPFKLDVGGPPPSAGGAGEQAEKKPRRKPLEFAGLPLGFWLIAAAGLAIAIFLAVKVLNR
ncbi:MAG: protein kinase domain-containing protein, partial [Planctomycetia bacterium]